MMDPKAEKIAALEKTVADMMARMQHLAQQNTKLLQHVPVPSGSNWIQGDPSFDVRREDEIPRQNIVPRDYDGNSNGNGGRVDDLLLHHRL